MSTQRAARYPHLSDRHRRELAKRRRDDEPIDHNLIRRGLCALILREEGYSPADALRLAYQRYPDART